MKDWDSLYKDKGILQKEPTKDVIEAVNLFKHEGLRRILDLGCGTGRHATYLLKKGFEVYGCDSSEKALEIAGSLLKKVQFKKCDMISLPYDDKFFDGILCYNVIQHGKIADIKKTVSEIRRVLRKGGFLFLVVISTKHPMYFSGEEIEPNTRINTTALDGYMPHHFFTEREMREFFKDFKIVKLQHIKRPSELSLGKKAFLWKLYAKRY